MFMVRSGLSTFIWNIQCNVFRMSYHLDPGSFTDFRSVWTDSDNYGVGLEWNEGLDAVGFE